ncbi:energy transducer TonB [Vibrio renipiscarius]|nr:energy transducer TonB [Vibrio renipiscarius]
MTKLRYLIAGLIACLIQGMALSYSPQEKVIHVSMEQGINAMQIQLLARAASTPTPQAEPNSNKEIEQDSAKKPKAVVETKHEPKSKKADTAKSEQKTATAPAPAPAETKHAVEPIAKPTNKPVTKPAAKPIKKEPLMTKTPSPKPAKSPQKESKTTKLPEEAELNRQQSTAQSASQTSEPMLVSKPQFSAKPVPVSYPKLARKKGLEGKALIEVWLNQEGKQIKQKIITSSGHSILDQRALNTIKQWQFSRRIEHGQAIAHRVHIPINFKLQ